MDELLNKFGLADLKIPNLLEVFGLSDTNALVTEVKSKVSGVVNGVIPKILKGDPLEDAVVDAASGVATSILDEHGVSELLSLVSGDQEETQNEDNDS